MNKLLEAHVDIENYLANQFKIAILAKMDLYYYGKIDERRDDRVAAERENEEILEVLTPLFVGDPELGVAFYYVLGAIGKAARITLEDMTEAKSVSIGQDRLSKLASSGIEKTLKETLKDSLIVKY